MRRKIMNIHKEVSRVELLAKEINRCLKSDKGLTIRQDQVLLFFKEYVKEHGRPPTVREISMRIWVEKQELCSGSPQSPD